VPTKSQWHIHLPLDPVAGEKEERRARWRINSANIAPTRISMTLPKVKIIPAADEVIE